MKDLNPIQKSTLVLFFLLFEIASGFGQEVYNDYYPGWTRDGRRIIFTRSTGKGSAMKSFLYSINSDGTEMERITDLDLCIAPSLSNDGRRIAFLSASPGTRVIDIYVINMDGTGLTNITKGSVPSIAPAPLGWSPDDLKILFTLRDNGSNHMSIIDIDEPASLKPLKSVSPRDWYPAWSSKADLIAFDSDLNGVKLEQNKTLGNVFIMKPDGSDLKQITKSGGHDADWSPDAGKLVYQKYDSLYLVDLRIEEHVLLVDHGLSPAWSPDGSKIAFISDKDGQGFEIYTIDLLKGDIEKITRH